MQLILNGEPHKAEPGRQTQRVVGPARIAREGAGSREKS